MRKPLVSFLMLAAVLFSQFVYAATPELAPARVQIVKSTDKVKIHTLIAPDEMMANTSHVIELSNQIFIVDGQFFAPYAAQLRAYVDKLGKPVTRFYISHDHPDHYIGFGDAFPKVEVYALKETRESIVKDGQATIEARRSKFGSLIAAKLNIPRHDVVPGTEVVEGVKFVFERSVNNEAGSSLVIKLPDLGVYVAQDIVYHDTHLFIAGPTDGWRTALRAIQVDKGYDTILPGHGAPSGRDVIAENIAYLDVVDALRKEAKTPEEYKKKLLLAYPHHAAAMLIDIYLPFLYP